MFVTFSCLSRLSHLSHLSRLTHLSHEVSTIILGMLESSGFRKYSTPVVFQLFYRRLCLCLCLCHCLCLCLCLCISISVWIWIADVMSFQKMYGLRGPWGRTAVFQLNCELRKNWCGWTGRDGTEIEGSIRGPRGPKNDLKFFNLSTQTTRQPRLASLKASSLPIPWPKLEHSYHFHFNITVITIWIFTIAITSPETRVFPFKLIFLQCVRYICK